MVEQVAFYFMLNIGLIIPSGDVDGRPMYDVYNNECALVADHAYKGEIVQYIKTKSFMYNEDLPDSQPIKSKPITKQD